MKLRGRLIWTVITPVLLLGVAVMQLSKATVAEVLTDKLETSLSATAVAVENTLRYVDDGAFGLNDAGELVKGEFNLSKSTALVENVKSKSGVDVSVFYGDTRYLTTIKDASGKSIVGEKADAEVVSRVIKGGESYFAENLELAGKPYLAYYMPFYEEGKSQPAGMIMTGIGYEHVQEGGKTISYNMSKIILGVLIFAIVAAYLIVNNMTKALRKGVGALEELADGNLNVEVSAKIAKRGDEIGNIGRAIEKLRNELLTIVTEIKNQCITMDDLANRLKKQTGETVESINQVENAVSDIAAALVTTIAFFSQFNKILNKEKQN